MRHNKITRAHQGFSLIELMVAITMAVFLVGVLVTVMANTSKNYHQNESRSRLQESARFAIQFLTHDLRMASYLGCASSNNGSQIDFIPISAAPESTTGSEFGDQITISFAMPIRGSLEMSTTRRDAIVLTLNRSAQNILAEDDRIIIADCGGAEQATVTRVDADVIEIATPLQRNYLGGAQIRVVGQYTYFIQPRASDNIPVLVRAEVDGQTEELVEGVEYLRLLYGIDSNADGSPDTYGEDFVDAESVVTIKLGVLVRSLSHREPEPSTDGSIGGQYGAKIDDHEYPILDLRLTDLGLRVSRKVFETTVMLRN